MEQVTTTDISDLIYQGQTAKIQLPDFSYIWIRETNGNDEGILSQMADATSGDNLINFILSVAKKEVGDKKVNLSMEEVLAWPIRNKYYTMFKVRLLSLGNELTVTHTCPSCGLKRDYTQDLKEFDNTMDKPQDGEHRIKPYLFGLERAINIELSSGKSLRFKLLDGKAEKESLVTPQDSLNKNTSLLERNLEVNRNGIWEKVKEFRAFSSKDMMEIRSYIKKFDSDWDCIMNLVCVGCNTSQSYNIFQVPGFFFPTGTLM